MKEHSKPNLMMSVQLLLDCKGVLGGLQWNPVAGFLGSRQPEWVTCRSGLGSSPNCPCWLEVYWKCCFPVANVDSWPHSFVHLVVPFFRTLLGPLNECTHRGCHSSHGTVNDERNQGMREYSIPIRPLKIPLQRRCVWPIRLMVFVLCSSARLHPWGPTGNLPWLTAGNTETSGRQH